MTTQTETEQTPVLLYAGIAAEFARMISESRALIAQHEVEQAQRRDRSARIRQFRDQEVQ